MRLEPSFWTALQDLAEWQGVRLSVLVARIAAEPDESPLATRLRVAALGHLRAALADARLHLAGPSVAELLADAPSPAFVIGPDLRFHYANAAFRTWLGPRAAEPVGRPLEAVLRLTLPRPVREILAEPPRAGDTYAGKAIHMEPGLLAVKAVRARPIQLAHGVTALVVHLL